MDKSDAAVAGAMKKIKRDGRAYRRRLVEVLLGFCLVDDCARCGSPRMKGYCCTYCGCGCEFRRECACGHLIAPLPVEAKP